MNDATHFLYFVWRVGFLNLNFSRIFGNRW